ncbi:MAG: hypothetical protein ACJ8G3_11210, partial [Burkholderiaceae bacterium]
WGDGCWWHCGVGAAACGEGCWLSEGESLDYAVDFGDLPFYRFTVKAKTTVLPVRCRVTRGGCTAVETSRESVPAAGFLFCSAKKGTKKGGPDDRAPLRGVPVAAMPGAGRG